MPLNGQASGGWTESSSALRILYIGVRNTVGVLSDDAFTQTNPPVVAVAGTVSAQVDTLANGVLSGSVAFSRPDAGSNYVGGPIEGLGTLQAEFVRPLGCFINSSNQGAYENLPGVASGKGPYVSAQGTFGNALFETQALDTNGAGIAQGDALAYAVGQELIASRNGYLMPRRALNTAAAAIESLDVAAIASEVANGLAASTTIGVLKMVPDSEQNELVYDQRI